MNNIDTTDEQKELDQEQFDAWQDDHAPDHYEPDWEPVESY